MEERITDVRLVADALRATIGAGCEDLVTCAGSSCCPIPFAEPGRAGR